METLEKILQLISKRGIEQQEFASAIGLKKQAISQWKNGTTKSYKTHIKEIADYFGVSVDYLLNDEIIGSDNYSIATINGDFSGIGVQGVNHGILTVGSNIHGVQANEVHSMGETQPIEEKEIIRIFRGLPFKKRLELLNKAVELEEDK